MKYIIAEIGKSVIRDFQEKKQKKARLDNKSTRQVIFSLFFWMYDYLKIKGGKHTYGYSE